IQPYLFDRKLLPEHEKETGTNALLFITAEVYAAKPGQYSLTLDVDENHVSIPVQLAGSHATPTLTLQIQILKFWWTWVLGEAFSYTAKFSLEGGGIDLYTRAVNFGVRTISLDEKTGEWRLNGVRFFIRGTNITPDMWLAHYTPELIKQDVQ